MKRPERVILRQAGSAGALRDTAVSHIGLRVPDVEATEQFYSRILGMRRHSELEGGGVRLGWGIGHHVVDLLPGEQGLDHYGFEVRDENGVAQIRERLAAAGHEAGQLDASFIDDAIGTPDGLTVRDPDGTLVHFHSAVHRQGESASDPGRRPIKFQHTTVGTVDVAPFAAFFADIIGFRISDQLSDGRFAWFRSNKDHHTLAVVNVGRGGDIDHYSYDLAEWEDFKSWCDRLSDLDVPVQWGPGRHGPGNNLFVFFDDPAGNHIELSAEMEKFWDGIADYETRRWEPTPVSVNLWGGQTPSWRRVGQSA